jgi:Flp pilus assembly protein TadB
VREKEEELFSAAALEFYTRKRRAEVRTICCAVFYIVCVALGMLTDWFMVIVIGSVVWLVAVFSEYFKVRKQEKILERKLEMILRDDES